MTGSDPRHTVPRPSEEAALAHIEADSARFYDVLAAVPPGTRVPSCPAWDTDDLIAHLRGVQVFWQRVVAERLTEPEQVEALGEPDRPEGREALLAAGREAAAALVATLRDTPPDTRVWTWSSEQSAGFVRRRQMHEACIHRVDAELTAAPDGSARTPIDALLATDGVDEALRVMYGGCPPWGTQTPEEGRIVRVAATDTGTSWLLTPARFTGTAPDGIQHDEPDVVVDTDPGDGTVRPKAILSGTAEDLYTWLWHRPHLGELHRAGDVALVSEVEATLSAPMN